MEFWKTSASSLREKAIPQSSEKQASQKNRKILQNKKDSFQAIRQLENAYGKYVFGANDKRCVIKVSRKSEYQENTFDQSREALNENRLFEKKPVVPDFSQTVIKKRKVLSFTKKLLAIYQQSGCSKI